jgi:anti-sigma-K factor RskA
MQKSKISTNTFTFLVVLGTLISITPTFLQTSLAQNVSTDLTAPSGGNLYGGDKKGTLEMSVQNGTVIATAEMDVPPANGQVYEGWLEDKGDASGYSLSLGKFNEDDTLGVNQTMVNPYTYTVFYVTAEPVDDVDPKPAGVVAGAQLNSPFGQ